MLMAMPRLGLGVLAANTASAAMMNLGLELGHLVVINVVVVIGNN